MKKLSVWMALACAPLLGQAPARFELANGAVVQYQPWTGYAKAGAQSAGLQLRPNAVRRTVRDGANRLVLAFDVRVDTDGKAPLRLWFAPIPGAPFFAQAPVPRDLRPGDHVLVDIMEQSSTGKKIFDWLCVGFQKTPMRLPTMPDAPAPIAPGTLLRLDHAQFKQDGVLLARSSSASSATRLHLALPNGAEYTLSSAPGPDFRLETVVYAASGHTVAVFPDGASLCGLVSASAIVDQPGAWLLWVRRDAGPTVKTGAASRPKSAAPAGIPLDQYNAALGVLGYGRSGPASVPPSPVSVPELKVWAER